MFMDRSTTNIAKNQLGFIDIIVQPMVMGLLQLFEDRVEVHLEALEVNREFWEDKVDLMQTSLERGDSAVKVWLPPIPEHLRLNGPGHATPREGGVGRSLTRQRQETRAHGSTSPEEPGSPVPASPASRT
jgi:hypothetical protein